MAYVAIRLHRHGEHQFKLGRRLSRLALIALRLFHTRTSMQVTLAQSPNLGFVGRYDTALVMVAARAEQYFPDDPETALMKLRQFGELLAQQLAARTVVYGTVETPHGMLGIFHDLCRIANNATHRQQGNHATALAALTRPRLRMRSATTECRRGGVATPGWPCLRYAPARPAGRAMARVGSLIIHGAGFGGRSASLSASQARLRERLCPCYSCRNYDTRGCSRAPNGFRCICRDQRGAQPQ